MNPTAPNLSRQGLTVPQMAYSTPAEYRRLPVNQV
jgi:hypothetical protein